MHLVDIGQWGSGNGTRLNQLAGASGRLIFVVGHRALVLSVVLLLLHSGVTANVIALTAVLFIMVHAVALYLIAPRFALAFVRCVLGLSRQQACEFPCELRMWPRRDKRSWV